MYLYGVPSSTRMFANLNEVKASFVPGLQCPHAASVVFPAQITLNLLIIPNKCISPMK